MDNEDKRALENLNNNIEQNEFETNRAIKAKESFQILQEVNEFLRTKGYYIKHDYFGGDKLIKIDENEEQEIALIHFSKDITLDNIDILPSLSYD